MRFQRPDVRQPPRLNRLLSGLLGGVRTCQRIGQDDAVNTGRDRQAEEALDGRRDIH
jgi:hypothetical protein